MAVEPHAPARRSITSAASRRPRPPPPTSVELRSPSTPAAPSARMFCVGKVPSRSTSRADGATVSVIVRSSASRKWVVLVVDKADLLGQLTAEIAGRSVSACRGLECPTGPRWRPIRRRDRDILLATRVRSGYSNELSPPAYSGPRSWAQTISRDRDTFGDSRGDA
jgi:hypothetical protein